MNRIRIGLLSIAALSVIALAPDGSAATGEAWAALGNLDIAKAERLFREELDRSPDDFELLRGLFLCAYFDLDMDAQDELVREMVRADPGNPYLLSLFEYVAAEMSDWSTHLELFDLMGEALAQQHDGRLRYSGVHMQEAAARDRNRKPSGDWLAKMGLAPGFWVTGPFENQSNIAAYRPVPFEGTGLDTLDVVVGKDGKRAGWTWLRTTAWGDLRPGWAIGSALEFACEVRCYFQLPKEMEVVILPGGACSMRILIDGTKAYDDPRRRNAVQREGVRAPLAAGPHEVTAILGADYFEIGFHLAVLDPDYRPIEGLRWLRFAHVPATVPPKVERIHPIFDPFDEYIARVGPRADTPYWKAMLRIFNGYEAEAVRELERMHQEGSLSTVGMWGLYLSLLHNDEEAVAVERLSAIKDTCSTPLTDSRWIDATIEDREAQLVAYDQLHRIYPDRLMIDLDLALRPLSNGDYVSVLENLDSLKNRYPKSSAPYEIKRLVYQNIANDPDAAYREFKEATKLTGDKETEVLGSPSYFLAMRDYKEAVKRVEAAYKIAEGSNFYSDWVVTIYELAGRGREVAPRLEEIRAAHPYNLDIHNNLYRIYSNASQFDEAQAILEEYHSLEPTAILPYLHIDSLHNHASYDSIFGSTDVMELWDREPTESELGESKYWSILDRQQRIVFESGLDLRDIHRAFALIDQSSVEAMQEYYLGFDTSERFNNLITARRLRRGQPPLPGQVSGEYVIFQDLKPGDAVEIRYRIWRVGSGDLWRDFWDDYNIYAGYYQRYWEYTIYSDRDDLLYASVGPTPQPVTGTHCGFDMLSWRGENTPAWNLSLPLLPPWGDIVGKVFISSIPSWEAIARWYGSISEAVLDENPRTAELASRLVGSEASDSKKLDSLYSYIVLDIPYQVIGFDYDSAIPQKPDDVLLNHWGDCKDKAHLLIRMLRDVGVEAWPVLVRSRDSGTKMPIPYVGFDHLIACCIIKGDTVFVDPADLTFPPRSSVGRDYAGQPCLPIVPATDLDRLRDMQVEDSSRRHEITIRPDGQGGFAFTDRSKWYNQEAAEHRDAMEGYARSELRRTLESVYSNIWGVVLRIDSAFTDPFDSIDSIFGLTMIGGMDLPVQTVGKTTVVTLPNMSALRRSVIPSLAIEGVRDYPIDLRTLAGSYESVVHLHVPAEYGTPQMPDPLAVTDSLFSFTHRTDWDSSKRILTMETVLVIEDGLTDLESFQPFCRQVLGVYDAPLLFSAD